MASVAAMSIGKLFEILCQYRALYTPSSVHVPWCEARGMSKSPQASPSTSPQNPNPAVSVTWLKGKTSEPFSMRHPTPSCPGMCGNVSESSGGSKGYDPKIVLISAGFRGACRGDLRQGSEDRCCCMTAKIFSRISSLPISSFRGSSSYDSTSWGLPFCR